MSAPGSTRRSAPCSPTAPAAGIAEVCSRAGLDVLVAESDTDTATTARIRVETSLGRAADRRKLTAEEANAALARLQPTTGLGRFRRP
ncbi:hypothetical protein Z951_23805 [Streptomyces sp. PRh5]|nr:hypothetical protein Z951_23805 [Streptomyces sp. PRh5]